MTSTGTLGADLTGALAKRVSTAPRRGQYSPAADNGRKSPPSPMGGTPADIQGRSRSKHRDPRRSANRQAVCAQRHRVPKLIAQTGGPVAAEVTTAPPHNDSPRLTATAANCKVVAFRQAAALN
jgi:hypothetical protein